MSNIDVGDIIEWMGAPVLCLSTPQLERGVNYMTGMGAYLRRPLSGYFDWDVGEARPFNFGPDSNEGAKKLWTQPLTDEEQALAMRLLLGA